MVENKENVMRLRLICSFTATSLVVNYLEILNDECGGKRERRVDLWVRDKKICIEKREIGVEMA